MKRLLMMLCALLILGSVAQAQTDLDCETIAAQFSDLEYTIGFGNGYYNQGDYAQAVRIFSCALEIDSTFLDAYVARGFALQAQGNLPAALEDYNRAIELDEGYIPAYVNRGILYTAQGRFGLALNDFDLVLAFEPDNILALHNRGVVNAIEGNYDFAMEDFEQVLALDPEFAQAHAAMGVVFTALALDSYEKYRDIEGDNARLPAGEGFDVVRGLSIERETGNFGTWLPLQVTAR